MSTTSQAGPRPARNPHQASTKHHTTDPRFAAILEDDFGIPAVFILDALEDEPQKTAIALCEWASRTDDPARALVAWARRHERGAYRVPSVARDGGRSDTRQHGRASGRIRRDESLRGVLVDPARLDALAEELGV